jgi:O-antigen ligase
MSWSRGGWLGLAAGLLVVAGLRNRRAAALTVAALIIAVLALAILGTTWLSDAIAERLSDVGAYVVGPDPARTEITDANFAVLERLAHWQAGLRMFADYPWLGVGIGNYAVAYERYALPYWYDALGHAHNIYVNFLAETGILGAGAFVLFWLSALWFAWRTAAGSALALGNTASVHTPGLNNAYPTALAIGVLGTLAYLSVHSLFDNLFVQHMQLQLALLLGGLAPWNTASVHRPGLHNAHSTGLDPTKAITS